MNVFIYVCVIFFFNVMQTSILNYFLPFYISPDLVAILVVYVAMTRGFREGLLYTLLASYIMSLHTGGSFMAVLSFSLITYAVARYVSTNFYTNDLKYLFLSIALPVAANKLSMLIWLNTGNLLFFMEHLLYMVTGTVITAGAGILIFKLFNWIDVKTGLIDLESVVEE